MSRTLPLPIDKLRLNIHDRVVIFSHKSPDGDAIGSSLGLYHALKSMGFEQIVVVSSGQVPANLRWLPNYKEIVNFDYQPLKVLNRIKSADIFFFLDFNQLFRLGDKLCAAVEEELNHRDITTIMIDHHLDPTDRCTHLFSDTSAAATAEVIAALFGLPQEPSSHITPEAATCLLTGILTDTGCYAHNSSRATIYRTTAALIDLGAQKEEAILQTFKSNRPEKLKMIGYILDEKLQFMPEYNFAIFSMSLQELSRFGSTNGETEGIVNMPLEAQGIEISAFLRETVDEGVKLSIRSVKDWEVNVIAQRAFGGGGHLNASGGEFKGSLEEAEKILIEVVKKYHQEKLNSKTLENK